MRRCGVRILLLWVLVGWACAAALAAPADVSLSLFADPMAVARGGPLNYEVVIENVGGGDITNATLHVPLPGGLDQWGAEVSVDGGAWAPYPANGLVPLAPLAPLEKRVFEIRVRVELGAPGSLPTTAEVLDPAGPLAEAVVEVNVLPSVDAGPDLIVEFGGSVHLVGTSAGDGGSGLAVVEWSDDGGGSFDDPSTLHPIYTPPGVSGVVELTLRVVDHQGGEASDSLRVRVNAPPDVDAGADRHIDGGDAVDLNDATASDVDGWVVTYAWNDDGAGGSFLPSADVLHPTYTVPALDPCGGGEIELTLTVTDDWDGEASDVLRLISTSTNRSPTVNAGRDLTVESGTAVVLDGSATDPDGELPDVSWEQTGGLAVELLGAATETLEFVAPESEASVELGFRLRAVDGCGVAAVDDVTVVVLPTATFGRVVLDVSIKAFDPWGFPLSPLDAPEDGDAITFVIEVTNTGEEALTGLQGWCEAAGAVAFARETLEPWERARAEFAYRVDAGRLGGRLRVTVDVRAEGPDGEAVTGGDSILFFLEQAESALSIEKTVDRGEVAVGEGVVYTYTIRNDGEAPVSDLALVDDRLGPIPLPQTRLEPGEVLRVSVPYTIRESDLPGPLTNTAFLTGFGASGVGTEAASAVSIEVVPNAGGAGGETTTAVRSVVISEIAWAGTPGDPDAEWIELVNLTTETVELAGWSLRWLSDAAVPGAGRAWRTVKLSGTIDPLPIPITDRPDSLQRLSFVPEDDGWRILDLSWWGVGKQGNEGRGYYVLERARDDVVANVAADLVYDRGAREGLDLPDGGTTLYLHAADGTIVDSANATAGSGWVAGDARSAATMERVNLLRGDVAENWQTSPGILTYGQDSRGRRLLATAGTPNSPSLETLTAFASSQVEATTIGVPTSIRIPSGLGGVTPSVRVTIAVGASAGGGGSLSPTALIATRRTESEHWVDLDPAGWPPGTICVWVTGVEGEAFLLPLSTEP